MSARKEPTLELQVLIAGRWGGEVVKPNIDFATGGPFHPEALAQAETIRLKARSENRKPPEGLPDPAWRDEAEDGYRWVGDVVRVPQSKGLGLVANRVLGVPDEVALAKPAEAAAFHKAVEAGESAKMPTVRKRTAADDEPEGAEPEAEADG